MTRTEEKIVVAVERWMVREGKTEPEWVHKESGIYDTNEEEAAWMLFDQYEYRLEKKQRVCIYWNVYRYSPPTDIMKRAAEAIERNSNANPANKHTRIQARAGELRTTLENILIAKADYHEKIDPIRGMF